MKPIIRVEDLSKRYRIGLRKESYSTLRDTLAQAVRAPLQRLRQRRDQEAQTLWALQDIDFQVQPGEVLGIIGRNGAGKSTLLKVLSRITEPTTGCVELYGRVGSLLEVGTGFHHELTGRENIYMNGAILGMRRREIARQFDPIVEFSEVGRFIDTPVKHYSSGMFMRLAFAVAAHLEPEILIVDEVLAVGDANFQKKCLGKMGTVAQQGRTVLFVSHNMRAMQSLCSRVIWINEGRVVEDGRADTVTSNYLKSSVSALDEQVWDDPATAPGNDMVRLHSVRLRRADPAEPITVHSSVIIEFEYWNLVPDAYLNLSILVTAEDGYPIFNTGSGYERNWHGKPFPVGLFRSTFLIPGDLLNDGTHRVLLMIARDQSEVIFQMDDAIVFEVADTPEGRGSWYGKWPGAVRPKLEWETELLAPDVTGNGRVSSSTSDHDRVQ